MNSTKRIKKLLTTIVAILFTTASVKCQQTNLGIGVANAHNSAIIELNSSNRGLLPPRVTTAQRFAIANPLKGLLVYDTDLNRLIHFNGSQWAEVGASVEAFSLPFTGTASTANAAAFNIVALGTGDGIKGNAVAGFSPAVEGTASGASGSYGVLGQGIHPSAIGVAGFSQSGAGVYGFSSNGGTALRGIATGGGYALNSQGPVRLSGGNTNPQPGAVLTSLDDQGNAVWKIHVSEMAFGLAGSTVPFGTISNNTWQKVHFGQEQYDTDNRTLPTTSASPTPGMSSFVAPVTGIYELSVSVGVQVASNQQIGILEIQIIANRSGNLVNIFALEGNTKFPGNEQIHRAQGSTQSRLMAGDIVYVNVRQINTVPTPAILNSYPDVTYFAGHLVFAE